MVEPPATVELSFCSAAISWSLVTFLLFLVQKKKKRAGTFVLSLSPCNTKRKTTGTAKWKATLTLHLLRHLGVEQSQSWCTPRFTWTQPDEDVVGAMIEVSRSRHSCTFTERQRCLNTLSCCFGMKFGP